MSARACCICGEPATHSVDLGDDGLALYCEACVEAGALHLAAEPLPADGAEYDAACERVDAWRAERLRGVRRVSATRWTAPGQPDEHRMYATERLGFVAEGRGVSLEAATIDLARKLPLPAPAPLPTRTTYAELGLADLGAEASRGATVRPLRAAGMRGAL